MTVPGGRRGVSVSKRQRCPVGRECQGRGVKPTLAPTVTLVRRDFLRLACASSTCAVLRGAENPLPSATHTSGGRRVIHTVNGPVAREKFGLTLAHEHVLVDFVGAAEIKPGRYSRDDVVKVALPHLQEAAAAGVRSIIECTPMFIGRDPELLRRLSTASGINLVTNTGLYGARDGKFLPDYVARESAARLARRWIEEFNHGLEGRRIRPGFIKSGVNPTETLSPTDRKLVEAAARTHAATGLAIAVHTGRGPGNEQIRVLREHGVAARAFIWVHAAGATDDALFAAADAGAWLSLDSIRPPSLGRHVQLCRALKERGHLGQLLVSHDAGWYDPAKPGGGTFRPYTDVFRLFLPALQREGFSAPEIEQLLVTNPFDAFAVRA